MFDASWLTTTWTTVFMMFLSGIGIYVTLMVFTRLVGLRSFSKMSSFDFAITVALGTVVASTLLNKEPSLLAGAFGLAVLYLIQYVISKSRVLSKHVDKLVNNEPLLLMAGERILHKNLKTSRVTEADLRAKLRMAGVINKTEILAVIFETSGDISVLTKHDTPNPWVFKDVQDADQLEFVQPDA